MNISPNGPLVWNGRKLFIADGWDDKIATFGLDKQTDWLPLTPGHCVSASKRVNAYRVEIDGQSVYFKTYDFAGQPLDYLGRSSKCAVEARSYEIFKQLGIPSLQTIAIGEERRFGCLVSCCIVTVGIEDTVQLEDFAINHWRKLPAAEQRQCFEEIFAETVRYLRLAHDADFFHYDLKWRNILIRKENGRYRTFWIDCPRGRKTRLRSQRGRMVDLSALSRLALSFLTKSQRYRFLRDYFGAEGKRSDIRAMWRFVDDHLSRRPPEIITPK